MGLRSKEVEEEEEEEEEGLAVICNFRQQAELLLNTTHLLETLKST